MQFAYYACHIAWLKTSHPTCPHARVIPSSCHPWCVSDCPLVASSFSPSLVALRRLLLLFHTQLALCPALHLNVNSVEGNNRCAFAQRGVLLHGDIPSSHRSHTTWRLDKNWKSRSKKRKTRIGNRQTKNSNMPENIEKFILLIQVIRIQRHHEKMQGESWKHQRQLQWHATKRSPKYAYGKPLFQKQKKAKASEAKTRFSCIAEKHESTRQRIVGDEKDSWRKHCRKRMLWLAYPFVTDKQRTQYWRTPRWKWRMLKNYSKFSNQNARMYGNVFLYINERSHWWDWRSCGSCWTPICGTLVVKTVWKIFDETW